VTGALPAAVLGGAAVALALRDVTPAGRRLAGLRPPPQHAAQRLDVARPVRRDAMLSTRSRFFAAAAAGLGVALVVSGAAGVLAGAVAALLAGRWLARLPPAGAVRDARRLRSELPLALDLLAACLQSGLPVVTALDAVIGAVDPVLGARLMPALTAFRLGAGPVEAWRPLAGDDVVGPAARTLMRAGRTGAPSADVVSALAARHREQVRADYERAARAVGVWAVGPLTVCFLPAFVLVGVVPIVWGLVGSMV
jgi:pilus assembly protein TadC